MLRILDQRDPRTTMEIRSQIPIFSNGRNVNDNHNVGSWKVEPSTIEYESTVAKNQDVFPGIKLEARTPSPESVPWRRNSLDYNYGCEPRSSIDVKEIPCFVLRNDTVLSLQIDAADHCSITNQHLDTFRRIKELTFQSYGSLSSSTSSAPETEITRCTSKTWSDSDPVETRLQENQSPRSSSTSTSSRDNCLEIDEKFVRRRRRPDLFPEYNSILTKYGFAIEDVGDSSIDEFTQQMQQRGVTTMEEDIFRTIRRKFKNRVAARKSRDRKCQRTETLKKIRSEKRMKLKNVNDILATVTTQVENLKKIQTIFQRSLKFKGSFKDAVQRLRNGNTGDSVQQILDPFLLGRCSS